jgi:hypothetical protein
MIKSREINFARKVGILVLLASFLFPGMLSGLDLPRSVVMSILIFLLIVSLFVIAAHFLRRTIQFQPSQRFPNQIVFTLLAVIVFNFLRGFLSMETEVANFSLSLFVMFVFQISLVTLAALLFIISFDGKINVILDVSKFIFISVFVFCLIQLALIIAGVRNANSDLLPQTQLASWSLSQLGIVAKRLALPISSGMHNALIFPVILICIGIQRIFNSGEIFSYCAVLLGLTILFIVDSRTALFAPFAGIIIANVTFKRPVLQILFLISLSISMPVVSLFLHQGGFFRDLVSARYAAFGAFSGREFIWAEAFTSILYFDFWHTIFGYGMLGQNASGAIDGYGFMFGMFDGSLQYTASLHNAALQLFFDGGILLVLTVLFFLWRLLVFLNGNKVCPEKESSSALGLISSIFAIVVISSGDVSSLPYGREGFSAVLLVTLFPMIILSFRSQKREW